jgi:hypothetical protein
MKHSNDIQACVTVRKSSSSAADEDKKAQGRDPCEHGCGLELFRQSAGYFPV